MKIKVRMANSNVFSLMLCLSNIDAKLLLMYQVHAVLSVMDKLGPLPIVTPAGKCAFKTIEFTNVELDVVVHLVRGLTWEKKDSTSRKLARLAERLSRC
jgi:hypothetical protein